MAGGRPDFGPLAATYDRLRPVDDNWWELLRVLAEEGDLAGRRVLDVGSGTGRLAVALAGLGARVWGVDPSDEMLAQARAEAPKRVRFKRGEAEALPFKDGWFERVVSRLVFHLLDRARALAEARRVLAPGGRLVVATFDPEHFEGYWLNEFFPRILEIDRARFPQPQQLVGELDAAGFAGARVRRLRQEGTQRREEAVERIRGRYISTLRLLDDEEFSQGLARAERELPAQVTYELDWAVVVAERSP